MENVFKKSMEFPYVFAHMESTWFFRGNTRYCYHGISMESQWYFHRKSMVKATVIPWKVYGATMEYPWSLNGISIENPWLKPR